MEVRTMFSSVMAAGLTLAFITFGCGGAQEEPRGVSRPLEIGTVDSLKQSDQGDGFEPPDATRRELKACINQRVGQWSEHSHAIKFDAKGTNQGEMVEVKIRNSTMHDAGVEECLRQALAAMTVPESAFRPRAVRPFSGGERMMREQRGPLGLASESQNPLVWVFVIVAEEVGVTTLIEVGVMTIAAIATIVDTRKKDPKDECLDKYEACMDSPLGSLVVDKRGHSVCETCRKNCKEKNGGEWPTGVKLTHRWQSCT